MRLVINWIIAAAAVAITSYLLPGVALGGIAAALITALVLGIVNAFIKPFVMMLTLPLNVLTLGLFGLVINALLIMLIALVVPGFSVSNFGWALLFSLVLSLVNAGIHAFEKRGVEGKYR